MAAPAIDPSPATDIDTPEWREYLALRDASEAARTDLYAMDDRQWQHVPYEHHKEWQ